MKPLDGVRGLAILMVVCSHVFGSNSESGGVIVRFFGTVFYYGRFGVDLFFVLSGFLITGILVDSLNGEGYFRKFYARRALRIFPLYYGVLALLFLLTPILHLHWNGMGWLLLGYLQNLHPTQIATFSPGAGIGLNHFWSLAIEEQFYLVWPAVVFFVRDRRRLLWTTLAVSAGALALRLVLIERGVGYLAIHETTITRADALLLGGSLSLLYRSQGWSRILRWAPIGFLAATTAVVVSIGICAPEALSTTVYSTHQRLWLYGFRYTVLAVGAGCLLAWSLRPKSICGWVFERRWLCFLGKYSYGIYVLHMIALSPMLRIERAAIDGVTHSKMLGVVGAAGLTMGLAVAAAYLSFHLYEKPFLRLKELFSYGPAPEANGVPGVVGAPANYSPELSAELIRADLINS